MQKYADFKKAGTFTLTNGTEVQGELCLKGEATSLDLYSGAFFDTHASPDMFGLFFDRSKVSLIKCLTLSGPGTGIRGDARYHFATVFPHYVIFGNQHISSSDRTIRGLSFTVDDAPRLFYDLDAFGWVFNNARLHMERIVEADQDGKKIEIGEYPRLFYYTGKDQIFVVDTVLGKISATHGISYRSPGPEGIHVENTIRLNLEFSAEKTVEEAIESILDVVKFLEVIAGRSQNISKLAFWPVSAGEHPEILDVYWCMRPHRDSDGESSKPHPADLPIRAATQPDDFANVLKRWLERHEGCRNARGQFSTALARQNMYDTDRIVRAANMFDFLPPPANPETVTLPPDLVRVRDNARKAFEALPVSSERDSVLSALGRIGKATLKNKIRSRAKLITDVVGDRFPELEVVVDQAVDCRNYHVHGAAVKIDYSRHLDQVRFFTDTLEFVFAASDLVESGWDISAWTKRMSGLSHPLSRYSVDYARQLSELKRLL